MFLGLSVLFALLFIFSFRKDKRVFKNAIYLSFTVTFICLTLLNLSGNTIIHKLFLRCLYILFPIGLFLIALMFILAGIIAIKKEGVSLMQCLSIMFGIGIIITYINVCALLLLGGIKDSVMDFFILLILVAIYLIFTFTSLVVYSSLCRILPTNKEYDFIIIHGAGLIQGEKVTPLLVQRLKKGIEIFEKNKCKSKIIVSGGQGKDEKKSEAKAMYYYLLEQGIMPEEVILEDKSTSTMENLKYSKKIMDADKEKYNCVFVTNDYHVFRTGMYANKLNMNAEGVGCKTALYYWPNAFIREYIAVMIECKSISIILLASCIISIVSF